MRLSDLKNIVEMNNKLGFNFGSLVHADMFAKEVGNKIPGATAITTQGLGHVEVFHNGPQEKKIRQLAAKHGGHPGPK